MHWKLFDEPKLLIQALDEPYSPIAKTLARMNVTQVTEGDVDEAGKAQTEQKITVEKEKAKSKSQQFARPSRQKKKDAYLAETYSQVTQDVIQQISFEQKLDHDWVAQLIRAQMSTTVSRLIADQMLAFRRGYVFVRIPGLNEFPQIAASARNRFQERAEHYVSRLTNHVVRALKRRVPETGDIQELTVQARAVMDSFRYRTGFIEDVEIRKAVVDGLPEALQGTFAITVQGR